MGDRARLRLPVRLAVSAAITASALTVAVPRALASTTWYASASSTSGPPCTTARPCQLDHAVGAAQNGDTVIVLPGTYSVTYNVTTDKAITLEGEPGQPRPSLVGASTLGSNTVTVSGGATVRDLDIETTNTNPAHHLAALSIAGGVAEDLTLFAGPGDSQGEALLVNDSASGTIVRTVLARSQAPSGAAVAFQDATQPPGAGTASVYNLTASAESSTTSTVYGNMAKGSALIKDSILLGQGKGIAANAATTPIDVSYSDFSPAGSSGYVDQGGNISAPPALIDVAAGEFQEAATSPTIDAGASDASLSATDLDGNPRTLGSAPDMGAYEYVPAAAAPTSAPPPPLAPVVPLSTSQPVFGVSVVLTALSGTVLVKTPGARGFEPLSAAADVPVGSVVDATHGVVALASAINRTGVSRTGDFRGGRFAVGQSAVRSGRTELRLVGGSFFAACRARGITHDLLARAARGRRHRRRVVRQLWGSDSGGNFTTIGNSASAAVRGTVWLTQDRCDGTLVKVFKGHVVVRDRRHHRTVTLGPGQSYLARARH